MTEAWEVFASWVMTLPADRIIGLITTAGAGLYAAWIAAWYGCKATWHSAAFVRRRLTRTPAPLAGDAAGLVNRIRQATMREGKTDQLAYGDTVVGAGTKGFGVWVAAALSGDADSILPLYTRQEQRAIRAAYDARMAFLKDVERDALRAAAAAGVALAKGAAPCPTGKLLCSCGLQKCGVCYGKAKAA